MGDWVRYKLDRAVDHMLVDEAQDTNAEQWAIIERLADEFFTGASEAEQRWRTLFTVGDFKQAIFGFQGTDPREFDRGARDGKRAPMRAAEARPTASPRASSAISPSRPASVRPSQSSTWSTR